MDIQRLRNLTTGRLHTEIEHFYQDVEYITWEPGVSTIILGQVLKALIPYLKKVAPDERLYDGAYDVTHTGDIVIPPMDAEEKKAFFKSW